MILERELLRDDKTDRIFVADGNHTQKTVMLPLPALTAKRREWSWLRVRELATRVGR
jgi:hypothetical protein